MPTMTPSRRRARVPQAAAGLLELALAAAPVALFVADEQAKIVLLSPSAAGLLGVPAEQAKGRTLRQLLGGGDAIARALAKGEPVSEAPLELPAAGGQSLAILVTAVPLVGEDGARRGSVGVLREAAPAPAVEEHQHAMEYAMGLSECFQVLSEMRQGNLAARAGDLVLDSPLELVASLGKVLNSTAEEIEKQHVRGEEYHESSMELAMGLSECFQVLSEMKKGNFEARASDHVLTCRDDLTASLGNAINGLGATLFGQISQIARTTAELKASASEIHAVARQTESNATEEAAAVDETQRTMTSLLQAANDIASGAQRVYESADKSAAATTAMSDRITQLSAHALKITDIVETVRSIADKTDILALNASLEGTRAGEAGRGFALVGAEMRRLAETVAAAVRQIKQLARDIQEQSRSAVLSAEEGQKLAEETRETAELIRLTTGQQRTGTEQVSQSMREVQQFTEQARAAAKEAATTADDLQRSADELARLLRQDLPEPPRSVETRR